MNLNKIDKRLLREIKILSAQKKAFCFVYGKNFDRLKRELIAKDIHIENEYLFINSFLCKASNSR